MSLIIFNPSAQSIPACCKFSYKGFTVSASTIFPRSDERVAVLDAAGRGLFYCFTVEEAVAWVDARVTAQAERQS